MNCVPSVWCSKFAVLENNMMKLSSVSTKLYSRCWLSGMNCHFRAQCTVKLPKEPYLTDQQK